MAGCEEMKRTELKRKTPLLARTGLKTYSTLKTHTPMKQGRAIKARQKPLRRTAHSTQPPTDADLEMFAAMRRGGCLACRTNLHRALFRMPINLRHGLEIHHLLSGGVRIGHHATVALCRYHHQGDKWPNIEHGYNHTAARYGPSLGREPRAFRAMYGDDATLLAQQRVRLVEITSEPMR